MCDLERFSKIQSHLTKIESNLRVSDPLNKSHTKISALTIKQFSARCSFLPAILTYIQHITLCHYYTLYALIYATTAAIHS